jgi:tetratricopeptide (TPR) repeat protein
MAILAREPGNAGALAGMGWIRSQQGNFPGAISFLERARLKRPNDRALAVALDLDRFRFLIGEAQYSLASNDLTAAKKRYAEALAIRPNNREASAGLNATQIRISADRPLKNSGCPIHDSLTVISGVQPPQPTPAP